MSVWDDLKLKHSGAIEALQNIVPDYSYSEEHDGDLTDDRLRDYMLQKLRKIKEDLFHIIAFLFETQAEHIDTVFPKLRDEADLLGDEVKIDYFKWRVFPPRLMELLVMHDFDLVRGLDNLQDILDKISESVLGFKRVDHKVFDVSKIRKKAAEAEKLLRSILITYKEREAIFTIEETDIEKAYERIRKEIAGKF